MHSTQLQACSLNQDNLTVCLLVHGAAVSCILVGGVQLFQADTNGRQSTVQLLNGFLRQGGLPAQDPGKLHMELTEISAAVDQRVVVVVGGQNPVRGWRGIWWCKGTRQ